MAKQLLIYENAVPISKTKHRNLSVKVDNTFAFAKEINAAPITAVELPAAAREYTIVFTGKGESLSPAVILGVRSGENLYVNGGNTLKAKYVPAFLRRYPFVFSSEDKGENLTLCIDESFPGCNQEGQGERIFDSEGKQTLYLKNVLGFMREYQNQHARTKLFCRKLEDLDLLETMQARLDPANGKRARLTGFLAVSRKKLKALSAKQVEDLFRTDELELIYTHLHSLRNFEVLLERMASR
jgi:hypothetical protein